MRGLVEMAADNANSDRLSLESCLRRYYCARGRQLDAFLLRSYSCLLLLSAPATGRAKAIIDVGSG